MKFINIGDDSFINPRFITQIQIDQSNDTYHVFAWLVGEDEPVILASADNRNDAFLYLNTLARSLGESL